MKVLPRFEKRRKIKIKFLVLKSLSESYIRKKNFWHFAALSGLELHIQKHFCGLHKSFSNLQPPSVASVLTWQMFNLHSFLGSISKEENKLHLDSFFLMPPPHHNLNPFKSRVNHYLSYISSSHLTTTSFNNPLP